MTVKEYITTYNILYVTVEQDNGIMVYHHSDFHKIPQEILTATNFIAKRYPDYKVHITLTPKF